MPGTMPLAGSGAGQPFASLTLPYSKQQQAQAQDPMEEVQLALQDENVREQAAAMLAEQGLEPPTDLTEMAPPQPAMPQDSASMNPQSMSDALNTLVQSRQGTMRNQGNG